MIDKPEIGMCMSHRFHIRVGAEIAMMESASANTRRVRSHNRSREHRVASSTPRRTGQD